jgi:uncharacterized NAD-dependent epimerase/dehydratase family protein|tara:strand:+ start:840 stop:1889 length:1050 start_codon:yes stop_codon:yes gene_type:complete
MKEKALVYTYNLLETPFAKTCHGLLRGSDKYEIVGIIDYKCAGKSVDHLVKNTSVQPEVFSSLEEALRLLTAAPSVFVLGMALPGGVLPEAGRKEILFAIRSGLDVVSGLHKLLSEDLEISHWSKEYNVELIDIRKPKSLDELTFWSGAIYGVTTPTIAVLGTDCAVGKRTTCRILRDKLLSDGVQAEMIYTGQTGWLQGYKYGFILDATLNDFVSGELEKAVVACDNEVSPDIILIEGQSSLRNPAGPCGSELILSANAQGVILQHAPGRKHFLELATRSPNIYEEVSLIKNYGAEVLAITLMEEGLSEEETSDLLDQLSDELKIEVFNPMLGEFDRLTEIIKRFIKT